ncbi:MAG: LysR family transcriptional regulator [Desulfobacterales bacterium]|nr:LysR family transcriptional regulator [Desulfobacterales bacterium]
MYNIEIKHLKLLKTITETGNLTRAAIRLNISQPALSRQLKTIEDRLGTALFERTKKRMIPTKMGAALNRTASIVLNEIRQAEYEVSKALHGETGDLKIGVHCVLCYKWLPKILKQYMETYPKVDIKLGNSKNLISDLKNGKFDLIISSLAFTHRKVNHLPLFEDEVLVVMGPTHRLASKSHITESDFNGESLISFAEESEDSFLRYCLLPARVKLKSFFPVDQPEGIIELVRSGVGIALLPKWSVLRYLENKSLVGRPFSKTGLRLQWNVSHIKNESLPAFRQQFINMLPEFTPEPALLGPG